MIIAHAHVANPSGKSGASMSLTCCIPVQGLPGAVFLGRDRRTSRSEWAECWGVPHLAKATPTGQVFSIGAT
jgi:hypothetical protein